MDAGHTGKIPLENTTNFLRRGLLRTLRTSNVIRLTFEGADPKFVTAVVNTYVRLSDLTVDSGGARSPVCGLV